MNHWNRSLMVALLGALAGMACAHAQPAGETKAKAAAPEKVFVTGSHIAQRVDPTTGLPFTTSPVRFYSREQLLGTGRQANLSAALGTIDPSISP